MGPYEVLPTSVKRHKLKWYGHVTWSSGLAKTILQGTVQGGRWRGRQRKWWDDNIKEWIGLEWNIIQRKAENCEEWRKLVVKSPVMPQRSVRLRDRWRWRWSNRHWWLLVCVEEPVRVDYSCMQMSINSEITLVEHTVEEHFRSNSHRGPHCQVTVIIVQMLSYCFDIEWLILAVCFAELWWLQCWRRPVHVVCVQLLCQQ